MEHTILIADSGSTKTDWLLTDGTAEQALQTAGLNPVMMTDEALLDELQRLSAQLHAAPNAVYFYGAGCMAEHQQRMADVLRKVFPTVLTVQADGDLLGAARAVCGHSAGIACILGTGSNSCLYDGQRIMSNIPPLGYILGDEGSGAALGKRFLNALFKGDLPEEILHDFLTTQGLTYADVIRRVYREPLANRFLASTSLYIRARMEHPQLRQLVEENFRDFFERNILKYRRPDLPVCAVGSIAHAYEPLLRQVATHFGHTVACIMPRPIDGLRQFHCAAR